MKDIIVVNNQKWECQCHKRQNQVLNIVLCCDWLIIGHDLDQMSPLNKGLIL